MSSVQLHLAPVCALALLGALCLGCVTLPEPQPAAPPPPAPAIKLTYRTAADRLNVAAGGTQLVAYQQPFVSPLPSCCTTSLIITSPHPHGIPGLAQATVIMKADAAPATVAPSVWHWVSGAAPEEAPVAGPREVWVMDIPQWQVDSVLGKLEASNFFQRTKVWNSEVFLAAEVGPKKHGKETKALPELDALILRSRLEGRLVAGGGLTQFPAPPFAAQPPFTPGQFAPPPFQQQFPQPPFAPPPFAQPQFSLPPTAAYQPPPPAAS